MEMTIQKLARLAGVSARTLRYYDETGLLKPIRVNSAGYRIYGSGEVDRLQHILFYRELGLPLDQIKTLLASPDFDSRRALEDHRRALLERRRQLDLLIENVERTMAHLEGRGTMTDKEKFEGFKRSMVEQNEARHGKEAREKYGEAAVNASNAKMMGMTESQMAKMEALSTAIIEKLAVALKTGDPAGPLAQEVAELHRQWLQCCWQSYSREAHAGLGSMYAEDPRFTAFYDDKAGVGAAEFLRDAILHYTGQPGTAAD